MFSNIQAIFFDLGDTLVRIRPEVLQTICNEIGQFRKKPLKPSEYMAAFQNEWNKRKTSSAKDLIREINSVEREIEYWRDYFDTLLIDLEITSKPWDLSEWLAETYSNAQSFECFEDVHSILADLRAKEFKLGLISNAFPSAQQIIQDLELEQYFQYSLLSFQDKYVKPEPEIYQFAVEKLNVDIDKAVFVDDRQSFVEAARDLGMKAYLIERFPNQPQKDELLIKSQIQKINDLFELKNEILGTQKVKRDTLSAPASAVL